MERVRLQWQRKRESGRKNFSIKRSIWSRRALAPEEVLTPLLGQPA
jgi:hypothetical protein